MICKHMIEGTLSAFSNSKKLEILTDFTVVSCEDKKADRMSRWIREEEYAEGVTSYLITCYATIQIWHQVLTHTIGCIRRYATNLYFKKIKKDLQPKERCMGKSLQKVWESVFSIVRKQM